MSSICPKLNLKALGSVTSAPGKYFFTFKICTLNDDIFEADTFIVNDIKKLFRRTLRHG